MPAMIEETAKADKKEKAKKVTKRKTVDKWKKKKWFSLIAPAFFGAYEKAYWGGKQVLKQLQEVENRTRYT